jgi:hypothetical protein
MLILGPTSSLRNGFAVVAGGACEASVSKDGHNAWTRGHPSRRAQGRAPPAITAKPLRGDEGQRHNLAG